MRRTSFFLSILTIVALTFGLPAINGLATAQSNATSQTAATAAVPIGTKATAAAADLPVYLDGIQSPWQDNSWSAAITYASTEQVYAGVNAVKVVQNAWGGLSLHIGPWGAAVNVAPAAYQKFEFAVYGGATGLSVAVKLENDLAAAFPQIAFGTIPANTWVVVSLPMSQLDPANQPIDRVNIMETSGSTKTFFVDNIRFVGSATVTVPSAPVTVSPINGATGVAIAPALGWNAASGAASYRAQLSTSAAFATIAADQSGLTGTTLTVGGLLNGTAYYWRVNAANAAGTSAWSAVAGFTTVALAPTPPAPALNSPTNGAAGVSTSPTIQWTASAGATSYRLQIASHSAFSPIEIDQSSLTGLSYNAIGLVNSTVYYVRVSAANSAGQGSWSMVSSFTTVAAAVTAADLPVYLDGIQSPWQDNSWSAAITYASTEQVYAGVNAVKVVQNAWGGLSLHIGPWGAAVNVAPAAYQKFEFAVYGGATGLSVAVKLENDLAAAFPQIAFGTIPANSWVVVSLPMSQLDPANQPIDRVNIMETSGSTKTFFVDNIRFVGSGTVTPPSVPLPGTPVTLSPPSGATGVGIAPVLSWNASSSAASYRVQLSTSAAFATIASDQSGLTGTSQSSSSLQNGTIYYWRVNATNISGTSAWSAVASFTTIAASALPAVPGTFAPPSGATGVSITPQLTWTAASGAASYRAQLSSSATFATMIADQSNIAGLSYNATGLANSTTYYWRINATNATGTSAWSTVVNFTTLAAAAVLPAVPVLATPINGATGIATVGSLVWGAASGAVSYRVQVSGSSTFATMVADQSNISGLSYSTTGLANSATYYWRVSAANGAGSSAFSASRSFATSAAAPPPPASGNMFVTAYFPDWSIWTMKPWQVDYSAMTHVIHFSADPDPTTAPYFSPMTIAADSLKLQYGTGNPDRSINFQDSLIQYAHRSGVKVLICIGGIYGTSDSKMDLVCNDINKIRVYVSAISGYCKRKGYDGVDIDWEFPNNQADYANLITVLRDTLDRWPVKGIITAAVYMMPSSPYLGANIALMNAKVDQINLMNYDMGVSTYAGFNAPLKRGVCAFAGGNWTAWTLADHSLDTWIAAGFAKSKLALGIPFYAWEFTGVDGPCQLRNGAASYRSYAEALAYKAQYPNSYRWDDSSKVPYLSFTDGSGAKHMVSYDDPTSLAYKISWAKSKGVGGIMIYELLSGWLQSMPAGQRDPLLQAVKTAVAGQVTLPLVAQPAGAAVATPVGTSSLPATFGLHPNFPNPFNPTTTITFQLPVSANVTLKIYNMLGQEVASLVDGVMDAGTHAAVWDSRNTAGESVVSGVYIYRMTAAPLDASVGQGVTFTRKLMLLK